MHNGPTASPQTAIQPGQIWLIEHAPAISLFACDRAALSGADVVLYDRALAPVAAAVLPAAAYAEPLPRGVQPVSFAISARALALAAGGWSVAQLVETPVHRGLKLQTASEALISLGCAEELPVLIIAKTAPYRQREQEACLRTLPGLAAELADEELLTLVFGPVVFRYPAPCHAFTANGLAG